MNKQNYMEKKFLTIKEASQFLNIHPSTLRNWEKIEIIKPFKFGGAGSHRRYTKKMLLKCIK